LARFTKSERLHLKKDIAVLFEEGEKSVSYPIRTILKVQKENVTGTEVAMLVSVSKRNFKKAVDRNRIKRQIREAYRQNKEILYSRISDRLSENEPIKIHIGLIYTAKIKEPWDLIERKVVRSLLEISEKLF
jgi:ribonuclease P protein component